MKKIAYVGLGMLIGVLLLAACGAVIAKLQVPNTGALELTDWQSFEDPNTDRSYMQFYILHDKERDKDYIVTRVGSSYYGGVTITERK